MAPSSPSFASGDLPGRAPQGAPSAGSDDAAADDVVDLDDALTCDAVLPLVLTEGERYPVGERLFTLTPRLAEATRRARAVLIEAARHGEVLTYGELSEEIDGIVLPRHMGPLMHMVGHDCRLRDEPLLPALVVSKAKGEVGSDDDAWAAPERRAAWEYWAEH